MKMKRGHTVYYINKENLHKPTDCGTFGLGTGKKLSFEILVCDSKLCASLEHSEVILPALPAMGFTLPSADPDVHQTPIQRLLQLITVKLLDNFTRITHTKK